MKFNNEFDSLQLVETTAHIQSLADNIERTATGAWRDTVIGGVEEGSKVSSQLYESMEEIRELASLINKLSMLIRMFDWERMEK